MSGNRRRALVIAIGVLAVLAVASAGGTTAGATMAGDQPTQVYPAEETRTVTQGETVEMDVWIQSDGGVGDVAVETIQFDATYDDSVLTVQDVEPAPWLDGDEPTDLRTEVISDSGGHVAVEQAREPPNGGTQGNERFVTITFEVADDAPTENTTVRFDDTDVLLTDQYPATIFDVNATLRVEEGSGDGAPVDPVTGAAVVGVAAVLVIGVGAARRL